MIPVFYSQDHKMHHPKYEYDRGLQIPYQEIPERIEYAREYLLSLSFTLEVNPDALLAMDQIARIHSPALIKHLQERSEFASQEDRKGIQPNLYSYPWIYPLTEKMREKLVNSPDSSGCFAFDTYAPFGKYTWQAAYSSANLAYCAAQSILKSESQVAYALCRPPGHHAGVEMIGGYCYLTMLPSLPTNSNKAAEGELSWTLITTMAMVPRKSFGMIRRFFSFPFMLTRRMSIHFFQVLQMNVVVTRRIEVISICHYLKDVMTKGIKMLLIWHWGQSKNFNQIG